MAIIWQYRSNLNATVNEREALRMKVAYARVSSKEQNESCQLEAFEAVGIEKEYIYPVKQSGKDTNQSQLQAMHGLYMHNTEKMTNETGEVVKTRFDNLATNCEN